MSIARLSVVGLAVAVAACGQGEKGDTGKPATPQGKAPAAAAAPLNTIDRSHAGEPAPAVTWEAKDGTKGSLKDFAGKPVLVNLWATWCAPCIAEMPALDRLAATGVVVLPVSQDMEGWQVVTPFWKKGGYKAMQPVLDQPGSFGEAIKARGLPLSVLYDGQGREVWRVSGVLDWDSAKVRSAVRG